MSAANKTVRFYKHATVQDQGVGLNISRTIAQQHGGQLLFANTPKGGAQVTLVLPLYVLGASRASSV